MLVVQAAHSGPVGGLLASTGGQFFASAEVRGRPGQRALSVRLVRSGLLEPRVQLGLRVCEGFRERLERPALRVLSGPRAHRGLRVRDSGSGWSDRRYGCCRRYGRTGSYGD